jgi:ribose transport system ATP-binding protein
VNDNELTDAEEVSRPTWTGAGTAVSTDEGDVAGSLLTLRHVSVSFGETRALVDVGLTIRPGEIRALLGQNGSGKSTLIKVLSGYHTPDPDARLWIGGREVSVPVPPSDRRHLPLTFVHQDLGLIDSLSIVDNFTAARWRREHALGFGPVRWRRERERTRRALAQFDLHADVDTAIRDLREGERAIVAIARALSTIPEDVLSILVLDEPTASLPRHEVGLLFDAVRKFRTGSHAVIFVSHRLEEVRAVADTVTVLRDGRVVLDANLAGTDDRKLVRAIVGRDVTMSEREEMRERETDVVLVIDRVSGTDVSEISFDLRAGEVVGLTGLAGMGQDAIPELILGLAPVHSGEVRRGKHRGFRSPRAALRAGVAYLAPSRARGGALMTATVTESVTLPTLGRYFKHGRIDRRAERSDTLRLLEAFDVRPRKPDALMSALSGGNQQKALLAKLDHSGAEVLVLHEPTQGVDVGARQQVLAAIREMKHAGRAILAISNDYGDLERICDRVLVFGDGSIRAELTGPNVTEAVIAAACLHATREIAADASTAG